MYPANTEQQQQQQQKSQLLLPVAKSKYTEPKHTIIHKQISK